MKKVDINQLLPNNDNFTMHESVSNLSMLSMSFLLNNDIVSNKPNGINRIKAYIPIIKTT